MGSVAVQSREFKRGDIWWIRFGDFVGAEQAPGRPGVILTPDDVVPGSPVLQIAWLTKRNKHISVNVETYATGQKSYIECNQLAVVDKIRFSTYAGTLTDRDMSEVEKQLGVALGIPPRIVEIPKEVEKIVTVVETPPEIEEVMVERDMYKKLYEKALDRLVASVEAKAPRVEKPVEKPKVVEVKPEPPIEKTVEPVKTGRRGRRIRCYETGVVYSSGLEAGKATGIPATSISRCVNGKQDKAGGYHWEYVED